MNEIIFYCIGLRPRVNAIIKRGEAKLYKIEMAWWLLKIVNFLSFKTPPKPNKGLLFIGWGNRLPIYKSDKTFFLYSI